LGCGIIATAQGSDKNNRRDLKDNRSEFRLQAAVVVCETTA